MSKPLHLHDGSGVVSRNPQGHILEAYGTTVPADASTGYSTGCVFKHTDGGAGTATYQNEGTSASADFNPVGSTSGAQTFDGAVKSSSPTGGVGYATGAGGAVTQITSASTGVTLNKVTGQITTLALTTAAAAEERFTVTNSTVAATDTVVLGTTYDGAGTPMLSVQKIAAGAFDVVITNVHAANALNALMVINYCVVKGVSS